MAKKSSIEKNERRRKLTKKFSGRRSRLKAIAWNRPGIAYSARSGGGTAGLSSGRLDSPPSGCSVSW